MMANEKPPYCYRVTLPTGEVLTFDDWQSARIEAELQRARFNDPTISPELIEPTPPS